MINLVHCQDGWKNRPFYRKINNIVALSRPSNIIIAFVTIIVAAFITGTIQPLSKVILASISATLITAAANAINDFFDIEIDRINKPHRPLPSGKLTARFAKRFAILLFVLGIFIAVFINVTAVVIAISAVILLYYYSFKLKRTVILGNLTVSLVAGAAFVYGGVAVERYQAALVPAIFAFLMHLGREIIKDIQDQEGDTYGAARTLPIQFGNHVALTVTTVVFLVLITATIIPYLTGYYNFLYLVIVVAGVDSVIGYSTIAMWRNTSPENLNRLSDILKIDMAIGLIALYCGKF